MERQKKKVLHLLQSNRFSGAENVVCQIIGMMRDEPDVEMVYCSREGQIHEDLDARGIAFCPISELSVSEVKRVIREQKPDVIHAHDMRASFVASRACGKITLISHIHNNAFDSRGLNFKSIAYLYAAKKAKHIFWVSNSAFEGYFFHKRFQKKSTILYNIIDVTALYERMKEDSSKYAYDVVYVGRLTYPKHPQRMIQVMRLLVDRLPNVRIAVAGTGDMEEETKQLCKELKLDENVTFLGFMKNPLKLMHDSKAMVMTSRWEGTPMCALEAMALGVPIVSTPTDGLKDLVLDDENGYLSDSDEGLAEKLAKIVSDEILYGKLSENARQKAEKINAIEPYKKALLGQYYEL
ncbi:MAG: glycosyltransferase [Ruminococcaceae bacterium]|nr:glycosyltransferase [Oscillospiraceae bacterium]